MMMTRKVYFDMVCGFCKTPATKDLPEDQQLPEYCSKFHKCYTDNADKEIEDLIELD